MKSHGTKIKIGTSVSNVNRTDSSTVSASASSAKLRGSQLDTPCPTATIFDLCTTANDSSLHKKRKTRSSKENASSSSSAGAGAGAGDTGGGRDKEKDRADRVAAALQAAEKAASRSQPKSTPAPAPLGPQVEIVNGQIVLRESSLMVPVHGPVTHEDFEEVEEGVHATARYSSFTQQPRSSTWGIPETKQFYEALRQCGTDFSLMQAFFPHRARKQLVLKFKREEKQHPELVKATLTSHLPLDLAPFEVHLGAIMPGVEEGGGDAAVVRDEAEGAKRQPEEEVGGALVDV